MSSFMFCSQLPVANTCIFTDFIKVQCLDEKLRAGVSVPSTEPGPLWLLKALGGAWYRGQGAGCWEQGGEYWELDSGAGRWELGAGS